MSQHPEPSPTTSIWRVLLTFVIGASLALLFGARGLVHAGQGMEDGYMRQATLAVGERIVQFSDRANLTWPWDQAEIALGRHMEPSDGTLLTSSSFSSMTSQPSFDPVAAFQLARWAFRRASPRPTATRSAPPLRVPSRANPLRLLVTGDSLSGYLGSELLDEASRTGPVVGFTDTHNGTGLVSPNFVDWSVVAQQQVAADNPDAVVVMMGGNDFQNMVTSSGRVLIAGTPAWTAEYQRRAAVCMRIWTQGSATRRVYWLSLPPARRPDWAAVDRQINVALPRAAKSVPGAEFLNILGPVTNHGKYADFVPVNGQTTLIREPDGVHLNLAGSTIVAHEVLNVLKREWHLGQRR